jgi:hypothetical protein
MPWWWWEDDNDDEELAAAAAAAVKVDVVLPLLVAIKPGRDDEE